MNSTTMSTPPSVPPPATLPAGPLMPFKWRDGLLAATIGFMWWLGNALGQGVKFLTYALLVGVVVGFVSLVVKLTAARARPVARTRRDWLLAAGRCLFWLTAGGGISLGVVPVMFHTLTLPMLEVVVWSLVAVLVVIELVRPIRVMVITSLVLGACGVAQVYQIVRTRAVPTGGLTEIAFPARGNWLVVQGGLSPLINHHYGLANQRHAIDLIRTEGGAILKKDGAGLSAYFSWAEPIYAPADGRVVEVENSLADNAMGQTDRKHPVGNHITISLSGGRYVLIAHLRQGSVIPRVGDLVKKGAPIAQCGNSGNTAMPHIHMQIQTAPEFFAPKNETVPMAFSDLDEFNHSAESTHSRYARRNDELLRK